MLMTLLHILLILLLIVLGLVVVLGLLLLFLPLRVEVRRRLEGPPLRIRLGAGPIHITKRFGQPKAVASGEGKSTKKNRRKKKKTTKKVDSEAAKDSGGGRLRSWFDFSKLDLGDTLDLALVLLDDLMGSITFEKLHVTVILHTDDAAKTGNLFGTLCAITGILYPELERRFVLRDPKITLDADFDAEQTVWAVDIAAMTRLARYPRILWKRRKRLWKLWKTIRRH